MKKNLICVQSGGAYSQQYVMNLWNGARKYSQFDFDFYVFTDNIKQHPSNLGWKFIPLPDWSWIKGFKPWWYKLEIFNPQHNIQGQNLYFDLDIVICNDIVSFWDYINGNFCILQDFNRAFNKNITYCNSSIMGWQNNTAQDLYYKFAEKIEHHISTHRGDQDYIYAELKQKTFWPTEWAMSWKWELKNGGKTHPHKPPRQPDIPYILPPNTKVIVCHGKPNPHEIDEISHFWNK